MIRHGNTKKKKKMKKTKSQRKDYYKEPKDGRYLLTLELKHVIVQKKVFFIQKIPVFSCGRIETI